MNEYFSHISYIAAEPDPAENDLELKKKLDESSKKLNADLNAVKLKNAIQFLISYIEYVFEEAHKDDIMCVFSIYSKLSLSD